MGKIERYNRRQSVRRNPTAPLIGQHHTTSCHVHRFHNIVVSTVSSPLFWWSQSISEKEKIMPEIDILVNHKFNEYAKYPLLVISMLSFETGDNINKRNTAGFYLFFIQPAKPWETLYWFKPGGGRFPLLAKEVDFL